MSLLGIDIGTSGCKAVAFDHAGKMLVRAYRTYESERAALGQSELDIRLVTDSIFACIKEASDQCKNDPIEALTVTSLGEACIAVNQEGQPVRSRCIMPDDSRSADAARKLSDELGEETILNRTGVYPEACYSLPLLARLYQDEPALKATTHWLLSWSDYISFALTGRPIFNTSSASRTLAFDVHTLSWIPDFIRAAGLEPEWFPELVSPGARVGVITQAIAAKLNLNPKVQVFAGCHDQVAACIGAGAASEADLMLGLGTYACAAFCRKLTVAPPVAYGGPLNIEPHALPGTYISYLYHGASGGLNTWLRNLCFADLPQERVFEKMFAEITDWSPRNLPLMLPEFTSDHGVFANLTFGHTRADMLLGAWMSALFYFRGAVMDAAKYHDLKRIIVSGGCAKTPGIRQLVADILSLPVIMNDSSETGALGCAMIAGAGIGVYESVAAAAKTLPNAMETTLPKYDFSAQYAQWKKLWNQNHSPKLAASENW